MLTSRQKIILPLITIAVLLIFAAYDSITEAINDAEALAVEFNMSPTNGDDMLIAQLRYVMVK
jgi:hypothetical protein